MRNMYRMGICISIMGGHFFFTPCIYYKMVFKFSIGETMCLSFISYLVCLTGMKNGTKIQLSNSSGKWQSNQAILALLVARLLIKEWVSMSLQVKPCVNFHLILIITEGSCLMLLLGPGKICIRQISHQQNFSNSFEKPQ